MKTIYSSLLITVLTCSTVFSNLHAADGETIYNSSCIGCHGTEVFTRPDRKVKNISDLQKRVRQCSYAIEAKWFDEEVSAVTEYLNSNFYKF